MQSSKNRIIIKLICASALLVTSRLSAQFENDHLYGRQPSARFEAMGRTAVSAVGNIYGAWANPAIAATIRGVMGTYAMDPASYYLASNENWFASNIGIGHGRGNFGVTYHRTIKKIAITTLSTNLIDFGGWIHPNLAAGIGLQRVGMQIDLDETYAENGSYFNYEGYQIDVGLLGMVTAEKSDSQGSSLVWGMSVINLFHYKRLDNYDRVIPKLFRTGFSLISQYSNRFVNHSTASVELSFDPDIAFEHQGDVGHIGIEIGLISVLLLRGGWYWQGSLADDYAFTYGLGLNSRSEDLFRNLPLIFTLGVNKMKQPSYIESFDEWADFYNFELIIRWRNK